MTSETYKQLKSKVNQFKELDEERKKLDELRTKIQESYVENIRSDTWSRHIPERAQDIINTAIIEAIDKRIHLINLELEDL